MDQKQTENMALYIRSIQMETHWEQGLKQQIDELAEYTPLDMSVMDAGERGTGLDRDVIASIQQELVARPELTQGIHKYKHEEAKLMYDLLSEENEGKFFQNVDQKA